MSIVYFPIMWYSYIIKRKVDKNMGYKIITIIIGVYLMWLGSKMKSKNFSFPFLSGLFLVFYYTLILTK